MRKFFICLALCTMTMAGAFFAPVVANHTTSNASPMPTSAQTFNVSKDNLTPIGAGSTWTDPNETVEGAVYAEGNRPVFRMGETNMLVTVDGDNVQPLMNPNDSTTISYDTRDSAIVDGANRSLVIWFDSFLGRHSLMAGGTIVRPINLNNEIFMIHYRTTDGRGIIEIFATRARHDRGWVFGIFGTRHEYLYSDMNGRAISFDSIANFEPNRHWTRWIPAFWLGMQITGENTVRVVDVLDRVGLLSDLLERMTHATQHPRPPLICEVTGNHVIAEDGQPIRLNPRTGQLTDRWGWALFNSQSGLPIFFHEQTGNIVTADMRPQTTSPQAVLLNAKTIVQLLEAREDFYMAMIPTAFGTLDVPVLRGNPDPHNPQWRLLNGQSADDIIIPMSPAERYFPEHRPGLGMGSGAGNETGPSFGQIIAMFLGGSILITLLAGIIYAVAVTAAPAAKVSAFAASAIPKPKSNSRRRK